MIKLAFLNLFRRKTRTFLAVLGIAIGVAAIISLVGAVDGTFEEFNEAISSFQVVMVMEKDGQDQTLSKIDDTWTDKLRRLNGVRTAYSEIWFVPTSIDNRGGGLNSTISFSTSAYGIDVAEYNKMRGSGLLGDLWKGSFLKSGDRDKVVIGKTLADDFDKFIGSTIEVNGKKFRVAGILTSENEFFGNIIAMDIRDARDLTGFTSGQITSVSLEMQNPEDDQKIAEQINFLYADDIEAATSSDFSEQFNSIIGSFRIAVFFVAAISAFVAGIGIINTILMSVLDRKKELGALKATGWTKVEIVKLILIESFFLGLVGAIAGVLLGLGIAEILQQAGINTLVSMPLLIQGFAFGLGTGIIGGVYPAWYASKLDPIEAMSYG